MYVIIRHANKGSEAIERILSVVTYHTSLLLFQCSVISHMWVKGVQMVNKDGCGALLTHVPHRQPSFAVRCLFIGSNSPLTW